MEELTSLETNEINDFKESLCDILITSMPNIPSFMIHDYNFDEHLKNEIYLHFQDGIDYDSFSKYYDDHIQNHFHITGLVKRSYQYINNTFDHMKSNETQIHYLKNIPQPSQKTDEWYIFRKQHLTGSNLWKVFSTESSRNQLIYEKIAPDNETMPKSSLNDSPLNWGHKYEPLTNMFYEYYNDVVVEEFGCIPHATIPFIAASPDGIVTSPKNNGRMVEIKNVVSRTITKIPKMEYYIQMQLQMEVCDLDECDFVETKFIEYENEEEFMKDKYNVKKGMIIVLIKDNKTLLYEYSPLFQNKRSQLDTFSEKTYQKYNLDPHTLEKDGVRWFRNVYWKLDIFSCVYVPRNKEWFKEAFPKIQECWDIIEKERLVEDSHIKYKAKTRKPKQDKSNIDLSNTCMNLND